MHDSPDRTPPSDSREQRKPSVALRAMAADPGHPAQLGALLETVGTRVHGLALLILALPETIPLPIPSASTVLGIPLILISLHLALFGDQAQLPTRVLATKLPAAALARAASLLVPIFEWVERHSTLRWSRLVGEHLIGVLCTYLSILLLLPLPLVNTPPAICLSLLAVGLIRRDGMFIALGAAGTLVLTVALLWAAERLWAVF